MTRASDERPDGGLTRAAAKSRGGTSGSKRRPANDARASILAAAEQLFYAQGIGAVGIDAVVRAAGVTKRTLYYHFASKDELVATYLNARDEATLDSLRNVPTERGDRPGDRILAVFDFVERWASTSGYRGCPFNNAVAEQTASPTVIAIARRHKLAVERWFAQQAAAGGARHAEQLGSELLVLLDGALNGAAVFGSSAAAVVAGRVAQSLVDSAGVPRSVLSPAASLPPGSPELAPPGRRRNARRP